MNNMRGRREKKNRVIHQSQAEDPLFDDTGYYDQIPSVISAPTDAISQQEMLRTSSSRFKKRSNSRVGDSVEDKNVPLSPTQQAFLESDENGMVVTSNRQRQKSDGIDINHHHYSSPSRSSRPGRAQASYADDTTDASTLPTFVSVGESIDLQKCGSKLQQQQRTDTNTFLVSKEADGSDEQQPTLLKLVSFEPTSSSKSSSDDHDTRKRLHYKEKLHSLTHRFMTSSAVGRSKEMISDIFDRAGSTTITTNAVVAPPRREDYDTTTKKKNDAKKQTVCINPSDTCQFVKFSSSAASPVREESTHSSSLGSLEHLISKIGQAFSACSSMCTCLDLDDTTVNHEGLVINIPKKKNKKKKKKGYEDCMCAGDILHSNNERSSCSSFSGSTNEEEECCWTDMSSLTGPTTYRYQKRYWLDDVPKDKVQWR